MCRRYRRMKPKYCAVCAETFYVLKDHSIAPKHKDGLEKKEKENKKFEPTFVIDLNEGF